jgi:hypothetical protein
MDGCRATSLRQDLTPFQRRPPVTGPSFDRLGARAGVVFHCPASRTARWRRGLPLPLSRHRASSTSITPNRTRPYAVLWYHLRGSGQLDGPVQVKGRVLAKWAVSIGPLLALGVVWYLWGGVAAVVGLLVLQYLQLIFRLRYRGLQERLFPGLTTSDYFIGSIAYTSLTFCLAAFFFSPSIISLLVAIVSILALALYYSLNISRIRADSSSPLTLRSFFAED